MQYQRWLPLGLGHLQLSGLAQSAAVGVEQLFQQAFGAEMQAEMTGIGHA